MRSGKKVLPVYEQLAIHNNSRGSVMLQSSVQDLADLLAEIAYRRLTKKPVIVLGKLGAWPTTLVLGHIFGSSVTAKRIVFPSS